MEYIENLLKNQQFFLLYPVIINKILKISSKDNRPAFFKSSLLDNIGALLSPYDHIIDNIYLGSCVAASDSNFLKKKKIKYICNISDNIPNFFKDNIEYFNIIKKDNGKDDLNKNELDKSYDFIINSQNTKDNILIHCFVGRSRSVSILIYYLMNKYDLTIKESILFLKSKRRWINPSIKFIENIISVVKKINN
jgi:protein-tyrosine phosphatase